MLALPLMLPARATNDEKLVLPFPGVAFAGRTWAGVYCECGTQDCICDPGEVPPGSQTSRFGSSDPNNNELDDQLPGGDVDPAPGALLVAFALLLWLRMR
jgi:hypothetical protein